MKEYFCSNPEVVDDGNTEDNIVYDNIISSSEDGIRATNSHDNVLENNTFHNIESSEYRLSLNSSILIRGQNFNDALIVVGEPSKRESCRNCRFRNNKSDGRRE